MAQGPLKGLKIVEFAGIGPAPYCGMLLSDLGADVVRIDRPGERSPLSSQVLERGRRSVLLDLKRDVDRRACLALIERADALIEGYRPGVMERLGLGPGEVRIRNPRLVYGRITGWGQNGPLAHAAGHDINYVALSGALAAIGPWERPAVPLNLIGDFGGGGLLLALGLVAGILSARASGEGQVIDAAMADGAVSLMASLYGLEAGRLWRSARESNLLDGGAPFYGVFECADHEWISIGAIEPKFYAQLIKALGLEASALPDRERREAWPELRAYLARVFAQRTRREWCTLLEGTDVCFAPVLTMAEAPQHPHHLARGTFASVDGIVQPAVVPHFSKTPGAIQGKAPAPGDHTWSVLADWGVSEALVVELRSAQASA